MDECSYYSFSGKESTKSPTETGKEFTTWCEHPVGDGSDDQPEGRRHTFASYSAHQPHDLWENYDVGMYEQPTDAMVRRFTNGMIVILLYLFHFSRKITS